jgi:hypothetical protein
VTSHSLAPTLAILPSVPDLTKGILGIWTWCPTGTAKATNLNQSWYCSSNILYLGLQQPKSGAGRHPRVCFIQILFIFSHILLVPFQDNSVFKRIRSRDTVMYSCMAAMCDSGYITYIVLIEDIYIYCDNFLQEGSKVS